jgi:chromosome segregation ATPase
MEALVKTVDPTVLELTATKAKVIRADLEAASKARNKLTATYKKEDSKMIQQLHQQMVELEGLSGYLPSLVERLQQLAGLHVQASTFATRLKSMEGDANQLGATVSNLETTLTALQANMVANMQTMEQNMKQLDEKLNKL